MGTDGGKIYVESVLYATSLSGLQTIETTWRNYQRSGDYHAFVDNFGNAKYACLESFEPDGRMTRAADGGYIRKAKFTFLYLN
jgi:hypothetical protein